LRSTKARPKEEAYKKRGDLTASKIAYDGKNSTVLWSPREEKGN